MTRPVVLLLLSLASLGARLLAGSETSRFGLQGAGPSASVEGPVLAVAFLPGDRWAVLGRGALRVLRAGGPEVVAERALADLEPVRFPGGLLSPGDDAVWVLASGAPRALLLAIDEESLPERGQAEGMPWPGCPRGLRYRPGTNLLEGAAAGLGDGPFLAVAEGVAVDPDGRLLVGTPSGPRATTLRAGPALAFLGDRLFAAGSASPPGPSDRILLFEREGDDLVPAGEARVTGSVRALAAAPGGNRPRLLAALDADGRVSLVPFEVRRAP